MSHPSPPIIVTQHLVACAEQHLKVPEVKRRSPETLEPFAKRVYDRLTGLKQFLDTEDRATAAFYIAAALECVQFESVTERYVRLLGWGPYKELIGEDGKRVKDDTDGKILEKLLKVSDGWVKPRFIAKNSMPPIGRGPLFA